MLLYDCKVGFRGADGPVVIHEARKLGVTAPEVLVLQNIHGDDLVSEIKRSRMQPKRPAKAERDYLNGLYGAQAVTDTLGPKSAKLPQELDIDDGSEPEPDPAPVTRLTRRKAE